MNILSHLDLVFYCFLVGKTCVIQGKTCTLHPSLVGHSGIQNTIEYRAYAKKKRYKRFKLVTGPHQVHIQPFRLKSYRFYSLTNPFTREMDAFTTLASSFATSPVEDIETTSLPINEESGSGATSSCVIA